LSAHQFRDIGLVEVKGKEPSQMWVVEPLTAEALLQEEDRENDEGGILFRSDELSLVSHHLSNPHVKKGTVVWLTGVSGSGKSSFLRAAGSQLAQGLKAHMADGKLFLAEGARVRSWIIVEQLVTSILSGGADDKVARVDTMLEGTVHQGFACVLHAYGVVPSTWNICQRSMADLTEEADEMLWRAKEIITEIICQASRAGDIFIIDDMDHTDATSVAILRAVIERCRSFTGIFSCGSVFPEFAREGLRDEAGRSTKARSLLELHVCLDPFSEDEIAELLENAGMPPGMARDLLDKTGGRQSYIMHLMSASQMLGTIEESAALLSGADPSCTFGREIATTRIDHCSGGAKLMLQAASILGLRWSLDTLLQILSDDNFDTYMGHLFVQELLQAKLIIHGSKSGTYEFSHDSLQDAAYHLQLNDRRQKLHLRFAKLMERAATSKLDFSKSQEIGQHYMKSSEPCKAYAFFLDACNLLAFRGDNYGVVEFLVLYEELDGITDGGKDAPSEVLEARAQFRVVLFSSQFNVGSLDFREVARQLQTMRQEFQNRPPSLETQCRYFSALCVILLHSPASVHVTEGANLPRRDSLPHLFFDEYYTAAAGTQVATAAHMFKYYRWRGALGGQPGDAKLLITACDLYAGHPEMSAQLALFYGHDDAWPLCGARLVDLLHEGHFIEAMDFRKRLEQRPEMVQHASQAFTTKQMWLCFIEWSVIPAIRVMLFA
jgi:hypothetical protein